MRILLVNPAYDEGREPGALLDRYDTLTGWGEALRSAGEVEVITLQRFSRDLDLERGGVRYRFRADGASPRPRPWSRPRRLLTAAREARADVVHANGLVFPTLLSRLRRTLPASTPMLVQHHAGGPPRLGRGISGMLRRALWRHGLGGADAFLFTAAEQAEPWRAAGLIRPGQRVDAIPESSRWVRRVPREEARRRSGIQGQPAVLWVGRLTPHKDPLTVLEGFSQVADALPAAQLTFVHQSDELLPALRARLAADSRLSERVRLAGALPPDALADVYGSADVFVSGSHDEGSGYALLEALSCGLLPVVTDIPSFRALTGGAAVGALWRPGDAAALARALARVASRPLRLQCEAVTRHFEAELSWPAVGRRALALYRQAVAARRR